MNANGKSGTKTVINDGRIKPELYWRGETPPSDGMPLSSWVQIPHEHYIPISKPRLINAIKRMYSGRDQEFNSLIKLIDGIYHIFFLNTQNKIEREYEYFNPNTDSLIHEDVSPNMYRDMEVDFLIGFSKIIKSGNFMPLTDKQYWDAQNLFYLFDLPIETNIDLFDDELLRGLDIKVYEFLKKSKTPKQEIDTVISNLTQPAAINGKLLVYTRGITYHSTEALFFFQKINQICKKILRGGKARKAEQAHTIPIKKEGVIFESRWLKRISLETSKVKVSDLFRVTRLQEPMFREVVILFRRKNLLPSLSIQNIPILGEFVQRQKPSFGKEICIKLFKNIPVSDLNIIFPEKKFKLKDSDRLILIVTTIVALVSSIYGVMNSNREGQVGAIFLASILISMKIIMKFLRSRTKYIAQVSSDIYHKTFNSDESVLQYLVHALEDQDFKEAMLAYTILERSNKEMTQDELDGEIEQFIHDEFENTEVDFEVDDALRKISYPGYLNPKEAHDLRGADAGSFLPIVTYRDTDEGVRLYRAMPLTEAIYHLNDLWRCVHLLDENQPLPQAGVYTPAPQSAPQEEPQDRLKGHSKGRSKSIHHKLAWWNSR